jgi:UDP-N-acetylglucosamine 2-epimerase (non-hydrolysing)
METIFEVIKSISENIKVVLPAHPNPNVRIALEKVGLEYVEPMDYITFLNYMYHSEYIITDSGGVQEEAASLGKKVIICRDNTERNEVIDCGLGILVPPTTRTEMLMSIAPFTMNSAKPVKSPFGDGDSSKIMISLIKHYDEKYMSDNTYV